MGKKLKLCACADPIRVAEGSKMACFTCGLPLPPPIRLSTPDDERTWAGRVSCGCGSTTVLLRGPGRLFECRTRMLRATRGEAAPFTEVDGKPVCTKCGQVIEARRSATGKRAE